MLSLIRHVCGGLVRRSEVFFPFFFLFLFCSVSGFSLHIRDTPSLRRSATSTTNKRALHAPCVCKLLLLGINWSNESKPPVQTMWCLGARDSLYDRVDDAGLSPFF